MVSPVRKYDYMAGVDLSVTVPAYRRKVYVPTTVKYWWEDAACQSSPAEDFEPRLEGEANKGKSRHQVVQENEASLDRARQMCNGCPVWHLCYQKANREDFFYTMRAGIEPEQFTEYKEQGRINHRGNQELGLKATCRRGHNNWTIWGKKRPRRKCVTCNAMTTKQKAEFDSMNAVD